MNALEFFEQMANLAPHQKKDALLDKQPDVIKKIFLKNNSSLLRKYLASSSHLPDVTRVVELNQVLL